MADVRLVHGCCDVMTVCSYEIEVGLDFLLKNVFSFSFVGVKLNFTLLLLLWSNEGYRDTEGLWNLPFQTNVK